MNTPKWLREFLRSSDRSQQRSASEPVQAATHSYGGRERGAQAEVSSVGAPFRRRQKLDLIVGLDFGTSATKAAVRELGTADRRVRPIVFGHQLKQYPAFVSPCVGAIADNQFVWGPAAVRVLPDYGADAGIRRIKMVLAGSQDAEFADPGLVEQFERYVFGTCPEGLRRPEYFGVAALALEMQNLRALLARHYEGRELDIRFNIGVPIDHMENSFVLALYRKLLHAAELLTPELQAYHRSLDLIERAASAFACSNDTARSEARAHPIPECVAQMAAYRESLEARPGLHGVIDIGAGTTGIAIVNRVGSVADVRSYWLAAAAIPAGAALAELAVADVLAQGRQDGAVESSEVLEALKAALPGSDVYKAVQVELELIHHKLNEVWAAAYSKYRKSSRWQGIPVFLCGGGSLMPNAWNVFAKHWVPNYTDHNVRSIPVPHNYDDAGQNVPFDRLAIAYGLTFPEPELGDYVLPKDSHDQTPPVFLRPLQPHWGDQPYPTADW